MDATEQSNLTKLALVLCAEHVPEMAGVTVRWGNATRAMGLATFTPLDWRAPKLTFSAPLMALATPEDRVETVHHEVAHLVVFRDIFRDHGAAGVRLALRLDGGHGWHWRRTMQAFGYERPKVLHDIHLARKATKNDVTMHCGCPEYARPMRLRTAARWLHRCTVCKQSVQARGADRLAIEFLRGSPELRQLPESAVLENARERFAALAPEQQALLLDPSTQIRFRAIRA